MHLRFRANYCQISQLSIDFLFKLPAKRFFFCFVVQLRCNFSVRDCMHVYSCVCRCVCLHVYSICLCVCLCITGAQAFLRSLPSSLYPHSARTLSHTTHTQRAISSHTHTTHITRSAAQFSWPSQWPSELTRCVDSRGRSYYNAQSMVAVVVSRGICCVCMYAP